MCGKGVAGKGLTLKGGMGSVTAEEQCDTEGMGISHPGPQSISMERKAVGCPPTSGPCQKVTKGIIPAVEHFPHSAGSQRDQYR